MFAWLRKLFTWLRGLLFGPKPTVKLDPFQESLVDLVELVDEEITALTVGAPRIPDRERRKGKPREFATEDELKDYLQDIEQRFDQFVEKRKIRR